MQLHSITPQHIANYLDGSKMAPYTWWRYYQLLGAFFQFCAARRKIRKLPMPRPRAATQPPFRPYVFSNSELRRLFRDAGRIRPDGHRKYDRDTLRSLLSFLYSTGALVREAIELRVSEIDLKAGQVTLRRRDDYKRTLPIGETMVKRLAAYLSSTSKRRQGSDFVFLTTDGRKLGREALMHNFRRLCLRADIKQNHGMSMTPGMHDLRHTFAVHCLSAWLKNGKELNQIVPVLSCYMGHVLQRSTEEYLRLVPARFSKQLTGLTAHCGDTLRHS
jgi:integrase/recombinase XerD